MLDTGSNIPVLAVEKLTIMIKVIQHPGHQFVSLEGEAISRVEMMLEMLESARLTKHHLLSEVLLFVDGVCVIKEIGKWRITCKEEDAQYIEWLMNKFRFDFHIPIRNTFILNFVANGKNPSGVRRESGSN